MSRQPNREPGRRTFLGSIGAGAAVLAAGCLGFEREDGDGRTRYEPAAIEPILDADLPDGARPVPVTPSASAVDASLDRVAALLERVPDDLDADAVPNGVVRSEIERSHERARDDYADAAEADRRFDALRESAVARSRAREAAAAFDAVEAGDGEERADLRTAIEDELEGAEADVESTRDAVPYAGSDPQRTLLTAARLEHDLDRARRRIDRPIRRREGHALWIGEVAATAERAGATATGVGHLAERHRERAGDATSFRERYDAALASAREDARSVTLPDTDLSPDEIDDPREQYDVDGGVAETVLVSAFRGLVRSHGRLFEDLDVGRSLVASLRLDVRRAAFARTLEGIRDGTHDAATPESVREARESAIDRLADAGVTDVDATPYGDLLVTNLETVGSTDRRLEGAIESGRDTRLDYEYATYAVVADRIAVAADASETFRERIAG